MKKNSLQMERIPKKPENLWCNRNLWSGGEIWQPGFLWITTSM